MIKSLTRGALIAVVGACVSAAPCFADALFSFNFGTMSGSITSAGNSGTTNINTMSETETANWSFTVSGAVNGYANATWNVTGGSFTLGTSTATCGGSITYCYIYAGTAKDGSDTVTGTLFEINLAGDPTGTVTGGLPTSKVITTSIAANTTVSASTQLISDLGFVTVTTSTTGSGTGAITSTAGVSGSGPYTWTAGSDTLGLDIGGTTPEPVSFLLLGSGLLMIGLVAHRRFAVRASGN